MHYIDKSLKFSFNLPNDWRHDKQNLTLTFFGPNGRLGYTSELIQIKFGTIMPEYQDPIKREKFMAEPGAEIFRSKLGNESNVVVLKKPNDTEITAVHDGVHYIISYSNDTATIEAVEMLKKTFNFPTHKQAMEAIQSSNDPQKQAILKALKSNSPEQARDILDAAGMPPEIERPGYTIHKVGAAKTFKNQKGSLFVPKLARSYTVQKKIINPFTPAEIDKEFPKLNGRILFIDFQKDVDGPQTATRLIKETLSKVGVRWINNIMEAEVVIWIQHGSKEMRYAFVVAHPKDKNKFIAAECGPRELTITVMTAVCKYFYTAANMESKGELSKLIAEANELNRAITGAAISQNMTKALQLMNDLKYIVTKLGSAGNAQAVKTIVDALADSAGTYESTGFKEAKDLREASIEALRKIGKDSIPWIKEGFTHSNPAVRKACKRVFKACGGKYWWEFW